MSNEKELIKRLFAIAEKQQQIITKLAQAVPLSHEPPAGHLEPNATQKKPAAALLEALNPTVRAAVVNIEEHGNDMVVGFKPGQKNQANYDAVLKTLQDLTNKNVIQRAYNLRAA